ncbi:hypothetical protein [Aureimonas sp. Leaf454]|uniref:hypothetical protein n=1 Tax=Aureimonas sp. Leaf454 TaxID=1736381 RepID=UPI000AB692D8|nr:hypothetical protein [Aureimonas sp. Leaf454]
MPARLPVLDGASRAASIAASEARLSRILSRTGGNDIILPTVERAGAEPRSGTVARS